MVFELDDWCVTAGISSNKYMQYAPAAPDRRTAGR